METKYLTLIILFFFLTLSISYLFGFNMGLVRTNYYIANHQLTLVPYNYICTAQGIAPIVANKLSNETLINQTYFGIKNISLWSNE